MLSGNGDPKLVMKGITHGACDYLVKPVRIEELRNIWQHVIRKKKFDSKSENNSNAQDKGHQGGGQANSPDGATDHTRKVSRKRKEDEEEEQEEEEGEENGHENEDPATQKKPRVVWSIELHRKFVAAVNQLGIESKQLVVITVLQFSLDFFLSLLITHSSIFLGLCRSCS